MTTLTWPASLRVSSEDWRIDARNRSGGTGVEGREQIVSSGRALWRASITVEINPSNLNAFRALKTGLEGRLNSVLVGPCGCEAGPYFLTEDIEDIPYSDDALHSDDAGFMIEANPISTVAAPEGQGSVSMVIDTGTVYNIEPGQRFGINNFLYEVTSVSLLGSGSSRISFRPRLRTEVLLGDTIEWCSPVVPMRLIDDEGAAASLYLGKVGTSVFELIEDYS